MSDEKAVATKQPTTLSGILGSLDVRKRFEEILGDRAAAFTSSVMSLYNSNDTLRECDPGSILQSAVMAATLDLPVNQSLGFAFIIPYKKDGKPVAQFQIGSKGFIQLAIRTGKYKSIHATEVYKDEIARWDPLTGEFEATPNDTWKMRDGGKPDDIAGYLSFFKLTNGYEKYWYWTVAQVTAHAKKYSKSFDNPYGNWKQRFKEMALKTVVKLNLSKWGILSIQMEKALAADQAVIETTGEFSYPDRKDDEPVVSKPSGAAKLINEDQVKLLFARITKSGIEKDEVKLYVKTTFKKEHFTELNVEELTLVLKWLEQDPTQ